MTNHTTPLCTGKPREAELGYLRRPAGSGSLPEGSGLRSYKSGMLFEACCPLVVVVWAESVLNWGRVSGGSDMFSCGARAAASARRSRRACSAAARCRRSGLRPRRLLEWQCGRGSPRLCEINQCVECTRQFFTKSFLGDDAAVLARSSGEEPASPRHRAGVASMAWRTTR